jgi:hypothetical protein
MKASIKALFIGLFILGFTGVFAAAQAVQGIVPHEGTIQLQGYTRFAFYVEREHAFITDGYTMNFLGCIAELTLTGNQQFTLHTQEFFPPEMGGMKYREITFEGKISPAGELKFDWPESWWELGQMNTMAILDQVHLHTGCELSGQAINKGTLQYMGYFDGTNFFADMHILGKQVEPGAMDFFKDVREGPIMINFMIDLEVVD